MTIPFSRPVQKESATSLMAHEIRRTSPDYLRINNEAYESLLAKLAAADPHEDPEAVLALVGRAAKFAATYHPGRFADGAIENVALQIGAGLDEVRREDAPFPLRVERQDARRRILHVATEVGFVGGHTRMIQHWMRKDQSSCHSLVLTNQMNLPIPPWLSETLRRNGGDLLAFPVAMRLCQRAAWLRAVAKSNADLVILHHRSSDVIPTAAFAVDECPPVVVLNQCDHQFWLGSSVADSVINLRSAACQHTADRRFVPSNVVLPVPLAHPVKQVSRSDARQRLGIPDNGIVLLSVARAEKYRPSGPYDFVQTAAKILDRQPRAHLYVVGESASGIAPFLRCPIHERLHFLGSIEDPSLYRSAADVYIESFPFGSQTALLEAALRGIPVVPAYAPLFALLVANDDALVDVVPNPRDEAEYIDIVDELIQNGERRDRLGTELRTSLLIDHVDEGWLGRLGDVYRHIDKLTHRPRPIPVTSCGTSDADVSLSLWHVADGRSYTNGTSDSGLGAVLCHGAYVARDVGNYAVARRFAWRALRHDPYQRAAWRLFGITMLGRTAGALIRTLLGLDSETGYRERLSLRFHKVAN